MSVTAAVASALGVGHGVERKGLSDWPWTSAAPPLSWLTSFGFDSESAVGLPAWLSVLFRLSHSAGLCPLVVYEGDREDFDEARGSWQWELLHERPSAEHTSFTFNADAIASYTASGNIYIRKVKVSSGRVSDLLVLDPRNVTPVRRAGMVVFRDSSEETTRIRGPEEIIHVRGPALHGDLAGLSPISALAAAITSGLRMQEYAKTYFNNAARPDGALVFPEHLDPEKAQEVLDKWNAHHQGPENAGRFAALTGGATIETFAPISMRDAAFVETMRLSIQQIGGLYGVPSSFLGDTTDQESVDWEQDGIRFKTFGIGPPMLALAQALSVDRDLFPRGSGLFTRGDMDGLIEPDTEARFAAHRIALQMGLATANERRRIERLPRHPDGDRLQQTPGGAPPNANEGTPQPTEEDGDDD